MVGTVPPLLIVFPDVRRLNGNGAGTFGVITIPELLVFHGATIVGCRHERFPCSLRLDDLFPEGAHHRPNLGYLARDWSLDVSRYWLVSRGIWLQPGMASESRRPLHQHLIVVRCYLILGTWLRSEVVSEDRHPPHQRLIVVCCLYRDMLFSMPRPVVRHVRI
jgi:hypothetical protein